MEENTSNRKIAQQPTSDPISHLSGRYERYALWIIMAITMIILLGMNLARNTQGLIPLAATAVYFLFVIKGHAAWWRHAARKDITRQATFMLAEGAVRLVASVIVFFFLALWAKGEGLVWISTAIFCGYFVALLIFDVLFITRNEINNKE